VGISYRPLWIQLAQKEMKKTDLYKIANISTSTLAKLSKNQPIDGKILEKLCSSLQCQPVDIIEYVPDTTL